MKRLLSALALVLPLAITALPALAQDAPSYAVQAPAPVQDDAQIRGRISAFDGAYALQVTDDNGYVDNIQLHEGTIINPTGLTLAPGMVVSILGYNAGSFFAANEIDTPYTFYAGVPYYAGHPWNYYGPSISIGFFFGNTGWWHGAAFAGPGRPIGPGFGARVYANTRVTNIYNGGRFQGRNYVAPPERGGYHAARAAAPPARGERR
jgi:hypothetical protein